MSIIPLLSVAPIKIPRAAMAIMVLNDAALAPIAEFMKFTASLLTPTTKSNMASRKRNTTIPKNIVSINFVHSIFNGRKGRRAML